jgi:23S rRNA (adenine2503-C2)-methyltransferase
MVKSMNDIKSENELNNNDLQNNKISVSQDENNKTEGELYEKLDIKSMYPEELTAWVKASGEQAFRAKQIYQWLHVKLADNTSEMSNIPKSLAAKINQQKIYGVEVVTRLESKYDGTNKFLFRLHDGNVIESVLMRYKHGNSVCISSQAGCRMGCRFCASTLGGLVRNLEASEMLSQIYAIQKITGERVSNVVVMGTGEPLDNYDNLIRFINILTDEKGLNISQRNITVSSCGLVPEIKRLADEKLSITFALSLHSPTDEDRRKLMPIANKYSIAELMEACRYYFEQTGRRVTFEYSLVKDENDTPEHAYKLCQLLKGMNCHVNLIPVNPVKERNYSRSLDISIEKFKYILEKNKINVTIRRSMGRDIDAACGQLRRKYEKANEMIQEATDEV